MFSHIQQDISETLIYSVYYAPRSRKRLYAIGSELTQRYLYPTDLLIGIIGAEGSGKSTLIQGLFPGLHLTNDDDGVNHSRAPLYDFDPDNYFSGHTFHIDMRHELAFRQMHYIIDAVNDAVDHGRRVIVEHFDLLYPELQYNAQVIFGIGDEIIVARPTVMGPFPGNIKKVVDRTIKFRLMAHTAEDITSSVLEHEFNYRRKVLHSDVKHGFVIRFPQVPDISISDLGKKVNRIIEADLPVDIGGENSIKIGDTEINCTSNRTHVKSTGQIKDFKLVQEYRYDPLTKEYLLIGVVGRREEAGFEDIIDTID